MKNKKLILLLIIVLLTPCIIFVSASSGKDIKITPWVNDFGNLLSSQEITELNNLITSISQNTTVEIAIVTFKSDDSRVQDIDPVLFAADIGEANGVGKGDTDNGIIILWIDGPSKSQSQGAIATGRGIESVITDAKSTSIGKAERHYLDDHQYYQGFQAIVLDIGKEINYQGNSSISITDQGLNLSNPPGWLIFILICIVVFILIILPLLNEGDGGVAGAVAGVATSSVFSGSSSSGGSGGGFSGGVSFGGGSFGGGGGKF